MISFKRLSSKCINCNQNINYLFADDYNSRYPPKSHPATYPSQGNGEWVLLSTKKGYSQPNKWSGKASDLTKANDRMSWSRKIKPTEISRYHEEDLKDKKRLLANGKNNTEQNLDEKVMIPLKILLPESEKTENDSTTRKVRLQVLPSSGSTSLTHGGMLEVDSNTQTVLEVCCFDKILVEPNETNN